ncbi:MAG: TldD/PmbA family protein [candidate division Zixibacteria bacterium]|nr:TldD/PmbA family protein [candidate division Zixibacteria bacterium]
MVDYEKLSGEAFKFADRHGASYTDVRFVETEYENIEVVDGIPELIDRSFDFGVGIRAIVDGAWGFASTADVTLKSIRDTARLAAEIARASAKLKKRDVKLAPVEIVDGTFETPITVDPFKVALSEKLDTLAELCRLMAVVKGITRTTASMSFKKMFKYFASTEGTVTKQTIFQSGAGIQCNAGQGHHGRSTRSYPNSSGQYETKGYELIKEQYFERNAPKIAEQAVELLSAKECPQGEKDIILDGPMLSLQIHESVGHPLELDRVFGHERNFSGTSFATPDKLGQLQYASEIVNVVNDPTAFFGLGSFGYDDEGVPSKKSYLIKDGVLVNYISSREMAARIGKESTGCNRAEGWENVPINRMTNTNLLPGKDSFDDLLSGIDDGIYMETVASWSIDDTRESFTMGTEVGWEIKGGKLGDMIKSPTYSDETLRFWRSCDGIGDMGLYKMWGTPNCGKGQPPQNMAVSQGCAPARFRGVKVGV